MLNEVFVKIKFYSFHRSEVQDSQRKRRLGVIRVVTDLGGFQLFKKGALNTNMGCLLTFEKLQNTNYSDGKYSPGTSNSLVPQKQI